MEGDGMSFNFITTAKKVTHYVAVGFVAVAGFAVSDAGQALIHQYPKLSGIAALLGVLGALYHKA
jgi:hypothetical protein